MQSIAFYGHLTSRLWTLETNPNSYTCIAVPYHIQCKVIYMFLAPVYLRERSGDFRNNEINIPILRGYSMNESIYLPVRPSLIDLFCFLIHSFLRSFLI